MKLDKRKPYGIVSGEDLVRFEQGGKMFDADEEEIVIENKAKPKKADKANPAPKARKEGIFVGEPDPPDVPQTFADDQLSAQIGQ